MTFRPAPALSMAQMQATLTRADTGAGASRLRFYSTDRPATPGGHADTPMCEMVLPKPCGSVSGAGVLTLAMPASGMVLAAGIPRWVEWVAADGALLTDGTVTDDDHGGDFQVQGGATAPGETSPMFAVGSLMVLGIVAFT